MRRKLMRRLLRHTAHRVLGRGVRDDGLRRQRLMPRCRRDADDAAAGLLRDHFGGAVLQRKEYAVDLRFMLAYEVS